MPNTPIIISARPLVSNLELILEDGSISSPVAGWTADRHTGSNRIPDDKAGYYQSLTSFAQVKQAQVTLEGVISDLTSIADIRNGWDKIEQLRTRVTPVTVTTETKVYRNVLIEKAENRPIGRGRRIVLTFKGFRRAPKPRPKRRTVTVLGVTSEELNAQVDYASLGGPFWDIRNPNAGEQSNYKREGYEEIRNQREDREEGAAAASEYYMQERENNRIQEEAAEAGRQSANDTAAIVTRDTGGEVLSDAQYIRDKVEAETAAADRITVGTVRPPAPSDAPPGVDVGQTADDHVASTQSTAPSHNSTGKVLAAGETVRQPQGTFGTRTGTASGAMGFELVPAATDVE